MRGRAGVAGEKWRESNEMSLFPGNNFIHTYISLYILISTNGVLPFAAAHIYDINYIAQNCVRLRSGIFNIHAYLFIMK